jgi:hypothetical protein
VYPPNPHDFHLRPQWPNMPCDSLSRFYNKWVNVCGELLRSNYDPNEKNIDGKSLRTKSAMQHSERLENKWEHGYSCAGRGHAIMPMFC